MRSSRPNSKQSRRFPYATSTCWDHRASLSFYSNGIKKRVIITRNWSTLTQHLCIELCENWIQQKAKEVAAGVRAPAYKTLKEWQGDFNSHRLGNHFCVETRTYFDHFNPVTKQQKFTTIRNRCIICSSMTSSCWKACGDVYLCNYTDNKYLSCVKWFHTARDITTARPLLDGTVDPNHVSKYFP